MIKLCFVVLSSRKFSSLQIVSQSCRCSLNPSFTYPHKKRTFDLIDVSCWWSLFWEIVNLCMLWTLWDWIWFLKNKKNLWKRVLISKHQNSWFHSKLHEEWQEWDNSRGTGNWKLQRYVVSWLVLITGERIIFWCRLESSVITIYQIFVNVVKCSSSELRWHLSIEKTKNSI